MADYSGFGTAAREFKAQFDSTYGPVNPEDPIEVGSYLNLLTASYNHFLSGNPAALVRGKEMADTVEQRRQALSDIGH